MTGNKFSSFHRRPWLIFFLLLALSLACNLPPVLQSRLLKPTATPTQVPTPTVTPRPLPPAVSEADPGKGEELPPSGTITLYFNQSMDRSSVEEALNIDPDMEGRLEWEDSRTMEFIPHQSLMPGSELVLRLDTTARAANGLPLSSPAVYHYSSPGYLRPTRFLPAPGGEEIDPSSSIMVTFNQPVVSLGEKEDDPLPAFSLSPSAPGSGEWINTSTYIYYPQPALAGGSSYTAQLNPDLTSTWGTPLEENAPKSWTFSTLEPALVDFSPADQAEQVDLDTALTLRFNQAMDADSFRTHLTLRDSQGNVIPGDTDWSQDATSATFQPRSLLDRNRTYTVFLPEETLTAGGTTLGNDVTWRFKTVGNLRLLNTNPREGFSTSVYQGVILYFNSPLNREELDQKINISPEVSNLRTSWVESDYALRITGNFSPLEDYVLRLDETLSDKWDSSLSQPILFNFSTRAFSPNLVITQGTHDLFLTGEENAIPAQGTNLYSVLISLGTIPVDRFPDVLGPDRYQALQNFTPADNRTWSHGVNLSGEESHRFEIPVAPDGSALAPGLYRFEISSKQLAYNPAPYLLAVSHNHLSIKVSPRDVLVWAVDLRSGDPVRDAPVDIYNHNGRRVFSGETDQEGVFSAEFVSPQSTVNETYYALMGKPGEEIFAVSSSTWQQGTIPYLFGLPTRYTPQPSQTYIYTERPIYRPGQTVHYRLLKRDLSRGSYVLPEEERVAGRVIGPGGELATFEHSLSSYGTAHGEYTLSEFAEPGFYRLVSDQGSITFQVAEYRKPEIDLQVDLTPRAVERGATLQAGVDARYYFDAPAGRVKLDWTLSARHAPFSLPGYQVGLLENRGFGFPSPVFGRDFLVGVDNGSGQTARDGTWTTQLPLAEDPSPDSGVTLPAEYVFEVNVQDESGFPVSARASTMVHPSSFYIGVKPEEWILKAGQQTAFDIRVVDWEQNPDAVRSLQAEFKKVTWERVSQDPYNVEYQRSYEMVDSTIFQTDTSGQAQLTFNPPEPGTYQLDVFGKKARTEILLWAGGAGQITWPSLGNQKLNLVSDQETYQVGEQARVFIPNPFPEGGQALVTLEREEVHASRVVDIAGSGRSVALPLGQEESPNVYLSVTLLGEDEEGRPDFRQGYINLPVEPASQLLNVEVIGKPRRTTPRGDVNLTLQVTDADGTPVEGEFSLAVVDQAVLDLVDPFVENIQDAFYGNRPLAVQMGLPMSLHAGRRMELPGGIGGGGGGAMIPPVRSQFSDTAYWKADIVTDDNGEARVTVTLPDNLTTWRVMVRGITRDTRVGQAVSEVVTTKDLLVRPVIPRFLVAGDHLGFAAVVHNNTKQELETEVSLQSQGLSLDDPARSTQLVTVPPGGRTQVEWWARVDDVDAVELVFAASAGEFADRVRPAQGELPVLRYTVPKTYSTAGELKEAQTWLESVDLPRTDHPGSGSLQVELSPSLAAAVLQTLQIDDQEAHSPLSVMAQLVPDLALYSLLSERGLEQPDITAHLDERLPQAMEKLKSMQNEDGGWGWWQGEESDRTITAYILFGLSRAEKAGVFVDISVVEQAQSYLMAALPSTDMLTRDWQFDRLVFQYFALSESGVEDLSAAANLFEYRTQLSPWARALLGLVMKEQELDPQRIETLFSDLESGALRSASGLHWEEEDCLCRLHSTVTTSAVVTYALSRYAPETESLPDAARFLIAARDRDGTWRSDYETAWSVLALSQYLSSSGEIGADFEYQAAVNGQEIISGQANGLSQSSTVRAEVPVAELLPDQPNGLEIKRGPGEGQLYYRSHLTLYRSAADVEAAGKGMRLSRAYSYAEGGDEIIYTQHGARTELITVHLTLVVEEDTFYLKVKDTIPAGAEILDTRLKTTQQSEAAFNVSSPFREGWGWWYFNAPQVYEDHITWSSDFVPAGTYQLTYTLAMNIPGEYQVLPAQAWQVYFPDMQATSAGDKFVITE